ncbi:MAG: M3 family metallopeptidase [Oligoflexales bacterium]
MTAHNPLLTAYELPPFQEIQPTHVVPAVEEMLKQAQSMLQTIEKSIGGSWEQTIPPMEELDELFHKVCGPIGHLNSVANSDELREAWEMVEPKLIEFGLMVSQNETIYQAMKKLKESAEWNTFDEAQQRILTSRMQSAENAGISLSGEKRSRFNELCQEESKLQTTFSNHVLDSTKSFELELSSEADIKGLPKSYLQLASQTYNQKYSEKTASTPEKGPWIVTLDAPSVMPFLEYSEKPELREKLYRSYITRASQDPWNNEENCARILEIRREKAKLLGHESWAHISLSRKMAENPEAVEQLQEELLKEAKPFADKEMTELETLAKAQGHADLKHWDMAWWSRTLKEKSFNFSEEELKPYFQLPKVLDGLFSLVKTLFNIDVKEADGKAQTWNSDVRYFEIFENGQQIASFFLDPYSRPENKRGGAWMNDCRSRQVQKWKILTPVAYLVCNFSQPVGEKPSLLTFREVETLFHEFGHGLQHMLTQAQYADVMGINGIEWDAVELPSQFMENWCYHEPTLMGLSCHVETGAPLPHELFKKIQQARTFRAASQMLRQLQFGLIDMALHQNWDPKSGESIFDMQYRIAEKTSLLPPLKEDRFLCSFGHIFAGGYAAGYYSYKWAEVLSADAFSAFEEAGLEKEEDIRAVGQKFKNTVLAKGGSEHPSKVFKEFRGRAPSTDALLRHSGLR